jgi:phenylacetate-coenzyme A ligase PaaK-like adenylate-forming protein
MPVWKNNSLDDRCMINELNELTKVHMERCPLYRNFVRSLFCFEPAENLSDLPYLPARAIKHFNLRSVSSEAIVKVLSSSGTSGKRSQIFVDKSTAKSQARALTDTLISAFGNNRYPMLVIDAESTIADRKSFSARTAAINGFAIMSKNRCFALDDNYAPQWDIIDDFLNRNTDQKFFVFGFTSFIWRSLVQELQALDKRLNMHNAFLLHGGGWKTLATEQVSKDEFKSGVAEWLNLTAVYNYYGMVEQIGSIYLECEEGNLHASMSGDAITRCPHSHDALPHGKTGLLQVFSTLPLSYPGHSILTEDIGRTLPSSECSCGHNGTIIEIDGRVPNADIRGCSDAYF